MVDYPPENVDFEDRNAVIQAIPYPLSLLYRLLQLNPSQLIYQMINGVNITTLYRGLVLIVAGVRGCWLLEELTLLVQLWDISFKLQQLGMGNTEFPNQFTEKQIQKLYARFKQIDEDNSGDLDPNEIFNVPELNQNPLVKRVISIFDKNKDGKISFGQFLSGLASLYGTDEEHKLRFAFKIYDIDEDGFITNGELFTVLKMMVGNNLTDLQLQQLVDRTIIKADLDYDGKISYEEFKNMVKDLDVGGKLKISKI